MRIAKLHMDAQDKLRFEIHGKSSVKYHLKANHQIEAKRWFWALNNAIQYCKDEAKEAERAQTRQTELLRQAKLAQSESIRGAASDSASVASSKRESRLVPATAVGIETAGNRSDLGDDDGGSTYDASLADDEPSKFVHSHGTTAIEGDFDDNDEYGDDASEREIQPVHKDAFMIAAHSARLQLELLSHISTALQGESNNKPDTKISDPTITQAFTSYEAAIANLRGLIGDLGRIALDRESFWQYRLEQEANVRRLWEENMAQVAREQEELEKKIGESEEKRKQTKRALRDALEGNLPGVKVAPETAIASETAEETKEKEVKFASPVILPRHRASTTGSRRKSTIADFTDLSDSDSDNDEEFFDAVDAGEVEVVDELPATATSPPLEPVRNGRRLTSANIDGSQEGEANRAKGI